MTTPPPRFSPDHDVEKDGPMQVEDVRQHHVLDAETTHRALLQSETIDDKHVGGITARDLADDQLLVDSDRALRIKEQMQANKLPGYMPVTEEEIRMNRRINMKMDAVVSFSRTLCASLRVPPPRCHFGERSRWSCVHDVR